MYNISTNVYSYLLQVLTARWRFLTGRRRWTLRTRTVSSRPPVLGCRLHSRTAANRCRWDSRRVDSRCSSSHAQRCAAPAACPCRRRTLPQSRIARSRRTRRAARSTQPPLQPPPRSTTRSRARLAPRPEWASACGRRPSRPHTSTSRALHRASTSKH